MSPSDLEFCGFTASLLHEFKEPINSGSSVIRFYASGKYELLNPDQAKQRQAVAAESEQQPDKKRDVIILLDDD